MEENCGNLSVNLNCTNEENTARLTAQNSGGTDAYVILDIPEGAQIIDAEGNVIYQQDGGPDKTKIKMPGIA